MFFSLYALQRTAYWKHIFLNIFASIRYNVQDVYSTFGRSDALYAVTIMSFEWMRRGPGWSREGGRHIGPKEIDAHPYSRYNEHVN